MLQSLCVPVKNEYKIVSHNKRLGTQKHKHFVKDMSKKFDK